MCSNEAISSSSNTKDLKLPHPILTTIKRAESNTINNDVTSIKKDNVKNLILDLDGTLIDSQFKPGAQAALVMGGPMPKHICDKNLAELHMYKRPGLVEFLNWCFDTFENVGK